MVNSNSDKGDQESDKGYDKLIIGAEGNKVTTLLW